MIKAQTLKGFRDFLPSEARARARVIRTIQTIFEQFGFSPLETPALEYAETLMGKYGTEADKLLYLFEDNGKRRVGLRYDQTVPLSRVIAQYPDLVKPFKRYQMQPVWRAENTQKGRFREFLQCDIDIVGSDSPLADAEIIDCTLSASRALGFQGLTMHLNDRSIFDALALSKEDIIAIDKIDKIGREAVVPLLKNPDALTRLAHAKPTERLWKIIEILKALGYKESVDFVFDPYLARGLDYYTSTIFELTSASYKSGSLAGGGRYDTLIGTFTGTPHPAIGIAFGFDRMMEALGSTDIPTGTDVFVTVFSTETLGASIAFTKALRQAEIRTEIALVDKLDKQLKYADKQRIPYVIIIGPDEIAKNMCILKTMSTKQQETLSLDEVIKKLQAN